MAHQRGENLIFLISQPRAGSTLLQLMLSGHGDVATTSEPWIALHPLYALRDGGVHSEFDSAQAHLALGEFLKQGGMSPAFYKEQAGVFLASLYDRAAAHQGKRLFLDKTPRYYYIIDELAEALPGAKFIILLRNPLAVLHSVLKTWVKDDPHLLGYYRDDLTKAPRAMLAGLDGHPGRCLKVRYEELVLRPEEILKEVCSFLGIGLQAGMLDDGARKAPDWKFGDPVGVHRVSRPTPAGLDSWKKGFSSRQERHLGASYLDELGSALVAELGYDFDELSSVVGEPKGADGAIVSWEEAMRPTDTGLCEMEVLKSQNATLMNSMSWKVTAPLRGAFDLIRLIRRLKSGRN